MPVQKGGWRDQERRPPDARRRRRVAAAKKESISRPERRPPDLPAQQSQLVAEHDNLKLLELRRSKHKTNELVRLRTEGHLKATSPEGLAAYNAANGRIDITKLLPRVTVPTLVIHEPAFPFGSFELCQEVATRIPGAEFLIVSDHSIAGRVHDETVTGIDRFLRGVAATETSSNTSAKASGDTVAAPNGLTAREVQILRKVAEGFHQ